MNGVLRAAPKLERMRLPFSEADYARAMYAARLRGEPDAEQDVKEEDPDAPGDVVSPVVSPET